MKHAGHSGATCGCLAVGRNALDPGTGLRVQHRIKMTMITGTAEMCEVQPCTRCHHISLPSHNCNNDTNDGLLTSLPVAAQSISNKNPHINECYN
jgi:hypothetical protein